MEYLLADRGYDANRALAVAREDGMMRVIPPKRSRKLPQFYDAALYQAHHLVDNGFASEGLAWRRDPLWQEGCVSGNLPDTHPS